MKPKVVYKILVIIWAIAIISTVALHTTNHHKLPSANRAGRIRKIDTLNTNTKDNNNNTTHNITNSLNLKKKISAMPSSSNNGSIVVRKDVFQSFGKQMNRNNSWPIKERARNKTQTPISRKNKETKKTFRRKDKNIQRKKQRNRSNTSSRSNRKETYFKVVSRVLSYVIVAADIILLLLYMAIIYQIQKTKKSKQSQRATILCILVALTFVLFTLPYAITRFLTGKVNFWVNILLILNSAFNSLVYFFRGRDRETKTKDNKSQAQSLTLLTPTLRTPVLVPKNQRSHQISSVENSSENLMEKEERPVQV